LKHHPPEHGCTAGCTTCVDARRLLDWPPNVPYTYPSKLNSSHRELITAQFRASHPDAFPEAAGGVSVGDAQQRPPSSAPAGAWRAAPGVGQDALPALDIDAIRAQRSNAVQRGPVLDAVRAEHRQSQAEAAAAAAREADARRAEEQQAAERQAAERQAAERQVAAAAVELGAPHPANRSGSGVRKRGRPTNAERAAAQVAHGGGDGPVEEEVAVHTARGRQVRPSAWRTGGQ